MLLWMDTRKLITQKITYKL